MSFVSFPSTFHSSEAYQAVLPLQDLNTVYLSLPLTPQIDHTRRRYPSYKLPRTESSETAKAQNLETKSLFSLLYRSSQPSSPTRWIHSEDGRTQPTILAATPLHSRRRPSLCREIKISPSSTRCTIDFTLFSYACTLFYTPRFSCFAIPPFCLMPAF